MNTARKRPGRNRSDTRPVLRPRKISLSYIGPTCPVRRMPALSPAQLDDANTPHNPPSARLRPPAIIARASMLPILHSPTPTAARHTKGGKCCHPPPPYAPRALPRSSRERLYFLYFTTRRPRTPDSPRAGRAAIPRPRTPCALSPDRHASVYTSYTSLPDTHRRQTHQGREVLPLPAPVTHPACTRCRAKA